MVKLEEITFEEIGRKRDEEGYAILDDIVFESGIDEPRGTDMRDKVWYSCKDGQVMIKTNTDYNKNAAYSELISCELAKQAGIETAEYDMVTIGGKRGIITKNMCKEGEELVTINELIGAGDINPDYPDATDIYFVLDELEDKFYGMGLDDKTVYKLMTELKKRMLFDLCIMETDRHVENISFVFGSDENGQRTVRLAPMYDTEAALCLHVEDMGKIYSRDEKVANITNMQEPKITVIPEAEEEIPKEVDYSNANSFILSLQSKVSNDYYTSTSEEMWKSTAYLLCEEPEVAEYYSDVLSKMDIKKAQIEVENKIQASLPEDIKRMAEACFESRKDEITWELDLDYEDPEIIKNDSEEMELT